MDSSSSVIVRPARNVAGKLTLPGDKSISHRYAMLAGIADGTTRLQNFSSGADCASTLACMQALGAAVRREGAAIEITGCGPHLRAPQSALDCGNSGSTMRMLAGVLAGQEFEARLVGDASLSRRPMARIIAPLQQLGANVMAEGAENRPPLRVRGGALH